MRLLTRLLLKHYGLVAVVGTVLAIIGGYYSALLYMNLRTDIEELLPTSARSVKDLNEVTHRLESIDNIVVLIFSKQPQKSKQFVDDLAQRLKTFPKTTISSVEYRIDKEVQFFRSRRALYIDLNDLIKIKKYISDRIDYEKDLYNPLNIFQEQEKVEPRLDYDGLQKKYSKRMAGYEHFPGGYYATQDETIRAVIVYMPGKGLDKAKNLKSAVEQSVADLDVRKYGDDLEVKYTGNVENLLEESAALIEDLELSTVLVMVIVALAMVVFYRSITATLALVMSLVMGTLWTFGVSYFVVGYLNANSAFLASIVLGNGVNFGIIFLARYLEERRKRKGNSTAIVCTMVTTSGSTVTAALAAGLSYGSLMLTGFRGFSQFGIIGLIGMVLCWLSAYTLLPAYLTILDKWFGKRWITIKKPRALVAGLLAEFVKRAAGLIWFVSLAGVVASIVLIGTYHKQIIETDLTKLRDKRSIEKGSGALYHYIDDIFKHSFSPLVILPKKREATRKIAQLFREQKGKDGDSSLITMIQTLDDFIPKDQDKKIEVLNEIKTLLPDKLLKQLSPKEKSIVSDLLNPKAMTRFSERDLPPLILGKFRELDGSIGKIVLVDKQIVKGADNASDVAKFVQLGREITDSVAPNSAVAGDLPINFDMFQAIIDDGPKATAFAFFSVIVLVIILFRKLKTISLVLISLVLGVTWLGGLILGLDLKINFLNFIALPITFGIGVDYGVNIFQRYRQEGPGKIISVIRNTGGAVLLSSLTTTVGYGSLLIAGNQAFVSFGRLAALGELTCVLAAVVSLPAFLCWKEGLGKKT